LSVPPFYNLRNAWKHIFGISISNPSRDLDLTIVLKKHEKNPPPEFLGYGKPNDGQYSTHGGNLFFEIRKITQSTSVFNMNIRHKQSRAINAPLSIVLRLLQPPFLLVPPIKNQKALVNAQAMTRAVVFKRETNASGGVFTPFEA